MEQFILTETRIVALLLVIAVLAIAVRRSRVPYTVALMVAGLALTLIEPFAIRVPPEVILCLFVPPLVFDASFRLEYAVVRQCWRTVLLLAVPGVVITALVVGGIVALGTGLPLSIALVLGALTSATDPVAVVALFRTMGAPARLTTIVDGESLVNDGTAIVLFNVMLAMALTGQSSFTQGLLDFVRVSAVGAAIGLVCGWVAARLIIHLDDYLIGALLTLALAFGAYALAERLHTSGVLALVVGGLVSGTLIRAAMTPRAYQSLSSFWEGVSFLANSLVFLLLGLQVSLPALLGSWTLIVWAVAAVLVSRVIAVYGLSWLAGWLGEPMPLRWMHVLTWGGLRGVIAMALALALPSTLGPGRESIRVMTFGIVLFTLLAQATTMHSLLGRLGIVAEPAQQLEGADLQTAGPGS